MKRLFFLFMLLCVPSILFALDSTSSAGTFVQDHSALDYTSVFRAINSLNPNQEEGKDCNPGIENPCKEGFSCQEIIKDEESQKKYPGLYKNNCLFRRDCSTGQKSPRVLCEEKCKSDYEQCHKDHSFGANEIDPCFEPFTSCKNACQSKDPKCSFVAPCIQAIPPEEKTTQDTCGEENEAAPFGITVNRTYLGTQNQECDSNRCLKLGEDSGLIKTPAYCVPAAKCVAICIEENEEVTARHTCCAGLIKGADGKCHNPDFIEEVPPVIIPEVNAGASCQPYFYESTNGVKNPDKKAVPLRQSAFEKFLLGFEYVAGTSDNIKDYFGINQEVMKVAQSLKSNRVAVQSADNADVVRLDAIAASLTQVASGMSFFKLLLEENKILKETDKKKAKMYQDMIGPLTQAMTYNSTRQWNKFTDRSKWIEIGCGRKGCFIIRLNDSICGKYIYSNKYCVKNCWGTPESKIIDPMIPTNLGKLSNLQSGTSNYNLILGAIGLGVSESGFSRPEVFTKGNMEAAMANSVVVGMSVAAAGISPALGGGLFGGFFGKFSRPKYTSSNDFNSETGMKKLKDTFIFSYADYALGKNQQSGSASQNLVSSMATEFDVKVHLALTMYKKDLADLSAQEQAGIENRLSKLKDSDEYMLLRKSLALAEIGKKSFEFFKLYGKANSCTYEGSQNKGVALDAVYKRVLYLANFYQASYAQREMMIACLDNLINGTMQSSYESGTGMIGGGLRKVRTGTISAPLEGMNSIDTNQRVSLNKSAAGATMNKIDFGSINFGSNMSSSSNVSKQSDSVSSGSFSSGNVNGGNVSYDSQAISQRLQELNAQAKANREELSKTAEGRSKLSKLVATQQNLDSNNFSSGSVVLNDVKNSGESKLSSSGNSLNPSTAGESGASASGKPEEKSNSNLTASNAESDLSKYQNVGAYKGNLNFDSKKGSTGENDNLNGTASAEGLTGLNTRDALLVAEGLKKDMLKYKSVPGDEDDSLFKIVTKAYFRVAYPIIFKKDDGIKKEEKK